MTNMQRFVDVFVACQQAIESGRLIVRGTSTDKEYHFQNWFSQRLSEVGIFHDQGGRNSHPDFTLVESTEGYELKALAYPGRVATYDANSQVPTGLHNGRSIYYVFGRYPSGAEGEYPVIDLVVCHGDFLNARHDYIHKNKSFRGFGSYGDILIRDRKMYVAPTPFALASGTASRRTLILPSEMQVDDRVEEVGTLSRVEADSLVVGYEFDLGSNVITPRFVPNPTAGKSYEFLAYRVVGEEGEEVRLETSFALDEDEQADD